MPELCSALKESMVAFCAVRVGDDARSPRFHRILFVGEEVSYVLIDNVRFYQL